MSGLIIAYAADEWALRTNMQGIVPYMPGAWYSALRAFAFKAVYCETRYTCKADVPVFRFWGFCLRAVFANDLMSLSFGKDRKGKGHCSEQCYKHNLA